MSQAEVIGIALMMLGGVLVFQALARRLIAGIRRKLGV